MNKILAVAVVFLLMFMFPVMLNNAFASSTTPYHVGVLTENITIPITFNSTTSGDGYVSPIFSKYVPSGHLTMFFPLKNDSNNIWEYDLYTHQGKILPFVMIGQGSTTFGHYDNNIQPFIMYNGEILDLYSIGANGSGLPYQVYAYYLNNNTLFHREFPFLTNATGTETAVQVSNSWFIGDFQPPSGSTLQYAFAFNIFNGMFLNTSFNIPLNAWNSIAYVEGTNLSIEQINDPSNNTLVNIIFWISEINGVYHLNHLIKYFYSSLITGMDENNMPYFERVLSNGTYEISMAGQTKAPS